MKVHYIFESLYVSAYLYIATPSLRSLFSGKLILSFLMISRFCEAVWPHIQRTIASSPRMIPAHRVPTASVELRALDVLVISHPGHYRNFRLHHHHHPPRWVLGNLAGPLEEVMARSHTYKYGVAPTSPLPIPLCASQPRYEQQRFRSHGERWG